MKIPWDFPWNNYFTGCFHKIWEKDSDYDSGCDFESVLLNKLFPLFWLFGIKYFKKYLDFKWFPYSLLFWAGSLIISGSLRFKHPVRLERLRWTFPVNQNIHNIELFYLGMFYSSGGIGIVMKTEMDEGGIFVFFHSSLTDVGENQTRKDNLILWNLGSKFFFLFLKDPFLKLTVFYIIISSIWLFSYYLVH